MQCEEIRSSCHPTWQPTAEEPQCDGGTDAQTVIESRLLVIALLQEVVSVWWPTLS